MGWVWAVGILDMFGRWEEGISYIDVDGEW